MFIKSEKVKEVLAQFEQLSDEDKDTLSIGLKNHYGKQITCSLDELSEMDLKDLETMKSIIGGMIITREYVPSISSGL